ncbi:hypothetical protein [Corallococcus sp. AS-1-6]|uniref:hypothetical protein n=1 Tax=Corallococcus sp. AS-1-6 TaxID=2874599 RepID=UPI001CBCA5F4|nr:hypothetical protein [Corallococcus sp. AS-1-6]MBZ4371503.1 hypothetical protein [Corallococcus sp. AS-1-6]
MFSINPSVLMAEAADLDARARRKLRQADAPWCSPDSAANLRKDAAILSGEATSKRAKATRLESAP